MAALPPNASRRSPVLSTGETCHHTRGVTLGSLARDVGYDKQGYGGTARTLLDREGVSLAYGAEGLARYSP